MLLTLLSVAALSTLPEYKTEILARTNGSSTFNLPTFAHVNSASPSINDEGDVAFAVISGGIDQTGDHSEQAAIWLKSGKNEAGRIVYYTPSGKIVSDPKVVNHGVVFSQFDEYSSDGVFAFDANKNETVHVFKDEKMSAVNYPQTTREGSYVFRSTDSENNRSFFEYRSSQLNQIVNEDSGYAYLFGPSVNEYSQWVFKARLGEKYNFQEEAIDHIVMLTPQFGSRGEKEYKKNIVAQDTDGDPLSPYKSFDNSPKISKSGLVVFSATLSQRVRAIVAVKDGVHYRVASEGVNDISQIEMFSPQINDNGFVVFRAKDNKGLRGVYLANPFAAEPEIKKILGEGSPIMTDQGMGAVLLQDQFPGFGGNVDINNNNEIVISAVLATENQKFILGTAIYKLHPL